MTSQSAALKDKKQVKERISIANYGEMKIDQARGK